MNDFDENSGYIKKKRGLKVKSYVTVILISSIISSTATGAVLNYKFTNDINNQIKLAAKTSSSADTAKAASSSDVVLTSTSSTSTNNISVNAIAKKLGPSVVGIKMTVGNPGSDFWGNQEQSQSEAEGSGIVISKDGYIMTNYHVVQYADPKNNSGSSTTLEVFLPDKRQAVAKFIGGDSSTDLAVIKIDLNNLTPAELGDSSKLEVGDLAVAIGNPLGMEFAGSVTTGIISALNRQVTTEDKTLTLIQTDAAINPGNSGGALVNSKGQVIGINTAKISDSGVEGLGFAIPINDAKPVVSQLIKYGYVKGRPLIGITGQEITSAIAEKYGLKEGIYVTGISNGSGAYNAGIQQGDIIIGLDGKEVKTMEDLNNIKKQHKAGDTVTIKVIRNKTEKSLKIIFSEDK